jgi:hypothetical protein
LNQGDDRDVADGDIGGMVEDVPLLRLKVTRTLVRS